ncbi:MAG: DinB family protein [Acidobacteriaceae bacterium]|nr:DinB family protein [Acidobacteriaceae bacterium]
MTISELLLPEFDEEVKKTRMFLERVPMNLADWKPHEKSMTLGRLAGHVAELPAWASDILERDSLDIKAGYKGFQATSAEELLSHFDAKAAAAREAIARASDEHFQKTWTFSFGGHIVFSRPRYKVLRDMMMDHLIHHRGQMSVYLRLKEIPVPGMYGPSADEK